MRETVRDKVGLTLDTFRMDCYTARTTRSMRKFICPSVCFTCQIFRIAESDMMKLVRRKK